MLCFGRERDGESSVPLFYRWLCSIGVADLSSVESEAKWEAELRRKGNTKTTMAGSKITWPWEIKRHELEDEDIRALCRAYAPDFGCFGYELPEVCR